MLGLEWVFLCVPASRSPPGRVCAGLGARGAGNRLHLGAAAAGSGAPRSAWGSARSVPGWGGLGQEGQLLFMAIIGFTGCLKLQKWL